MSFIEKLMGEIRSGTRVPGETLKSNRRVSVDSLTEFAEKKWSLKEANFKRQFSTMDKYEKFAAEVGVLDQFEIPLWGLKMCCGQP